MADTMEILLEEEYDTEALGYDYDELQISSNITNYVQDRNKYRIVKNCFLNLQSKAQIRAI